jgi:hypothetical protein
MDEYFKQYAAFQVKKPYRVVEIKAEGNGPTEQAELALNQMQDRGYEMTAVIPADQYRKANRMLVFRSVPPLVPSNTDVINEYTRRKAKGETGSDEFDFEKQFGPTIGPKQ